MDSSDLSRLQISRSRQNINLLNHGIPEIKNGVKSSATNVLCTGGIGDLLLSINALEALNEQVGDVVIHTANARVAKLFTDLPVVQSNILIGFDWFISIGTMPIFMFSNKFKGFKNWRMNDIFLRHSSMLSDGYRLLNEVQPYGDNLLAEMALKDGLNRRTLPFAAFGLEYRKKTLSGFYPPRLFDKYITIHNGFDQNKGINGPSTKNWCLANWAWLVRELKMSFPKMMIIQLGPMDTDKIPGCDLNALGLPFDKSISILSGSRLHIDCESGLVHIANCLGLKSIVMFGPTNMDFFKYDENINIGPNECGNCWHINEDWMSRCVAEYKSNRCMQSIDPLRVFKEVSKEVENDFR